MKIMHDAHYHYSEEILKQQKKYRIPGICSTADPSEYAVAKKNGLTISCGIHPWHADNTSFDEMLPLMKEAHFIGEIGMDSVWCDVDLLVQKEVFEKQIILAKEWKKPVILHTKGQEKEILDILNQYPNMYLIHWYSCLDWLKEYDQIASYFTIGPSVGNDEAVTQVAEEISLDKLLLETDGISAIEWANGNREYYPTLKHSIEVIAEIKGISSSETEKILDRNFERFIEEGR